MSYYEKKLKAQNTTIAEQEVIIGKLENHIFVNMRTRAAEDLMETEVIVSKAPEI